MLLAIDTSTSNIGIAVYDGNSIIGEANWLSLNRHTVILAASVKNLFDTVDTDITKLRGIAVAMGPGSFTSLRVGLSFAKGMALGLDVPVIGVPTLDILAAAQPINGLPLCAVLQAGRTKLAAAFYNPSKDKWAESLPVSVYTTESLCEAITEPTTVCGELTVDMRTYFRRNNKNIRMASPAMCLRRAGFLAEIAWARLEKGDYPPPNTLSPIYLHTKEPISQ